MSTVAPFKHEYMRFSEGGLDEKLYYDRYSTPQHDIDKIDINDIVVCKLDRTTDKRIIGVLKDKSDIENVVVETRVLTTDGLVKEIKKFHHELISKPLDTKPYQFWERWAKAGASVERESIREQIENDLRWLFDGFRTSPGGRIQLMAGQEFVLGERAHLTAFNCFVIPSPKFDEKDWHKAVIDKAFAKLAMLAVIDNAVSEAQIMARGGGVGYNATPIPPKTMGAGTTKEDIVLYLPLKHKDQEILEDLKKLGKFDSVTIISTQEQYDHYSKTHNVYVVSDSREGLLNANKSMVEHAYDGKKILLDFSNIRHKGALVKGVNGRSSGAPSWMVLFNTVAKLLHKDFFSAVDTMDVQSEIVKLIEQGGSRRGALMIVLMADHPNAEAFIQRKLDKGFIEGANISVGINDDFMRKARISGTNEERVWNLIVYCAWKSAEPGVLFMEYANNESNSWYLYPLIATNPCGEQFLPDWGVCNLNHLVLSRFYDEATNDVDWYGLARAIRLVVRFGDNMIDYTEYFMDENRERQLNERRQGVGTMGLATLLIKMGIAYGSDESLEFIDKLYKFFAVEAYKTSIDLAEEKGAFPLFDAEKMSQSGFMRRLLPELPKEYQDKFFRTGIRNICILTQAPTGSTGTAIDNLLQQYDDGTSTGIEPYFAFEYWRASRSGDVVKQTVPLIDKIAEIEGKAIDQIPYLVTAEALSPEGHVRVQAKIQKWVDSSISKTANCPSTFTVEDTKKLYELAYDLGCKGVTIYRDGSRDAQVLSTSKEGAKLETDIEQAELAKIKESESTITVKSNGDVNVCGSNIEIAKTKVGIKKRPADLPAIVRKVKYQCNNAMTKAYVTVCWDENGNPIEVFIMPTEESEMPNAFALSRMITQFLRFGSTTDNVEQTLKHLKKGQSMLSLPSQVARLIADIQYKKIEINGISKGGDENVKPKLGKCKSCGENGYDKANCLCVLCGFSSCN